MWNLQKWRNWSRCHLGAESGGPKEPHIRWSSRFPRGRVNYCGLSTHWKALCITAAFYIAKDQSRHHSTIAGQQSVSHFIVSPVKNPLLCKLAFCQNSLTTCLHNSVWQKQLTLLLYSSMKLPSAKRNRLSGRTLQFMLYTVHGASYL